MSDAAGEAYNLSEIIYAIRRAVELPEYRNGPRLSSTQGSQISRYTTDPRHCMGVSVKRWGLLADYFACTTDPVCIRRWPVSDDQLHARRACPYKAVLIRGARSSIVPDHLIKLINT